MFTGGTKKKQTNPLAGLACGRSLDEQLGAIRAQGNQAAVPVLRAGLLAALGVAPAKQSAANALLFGCYRPFTTPYLVRDVIRLLDLLAVDYTWLDKEYRCGLALIGQAGPGEEAAMRGLMQEFVGGNQALAQAKGAARLAYCCAGCTQVAKGSLPEAGANHVYILDLLLDALAGRHLAGQPLAVGYFEGCHSTYAPYFPQVRLDWPRYRSFLDGVGGLRAVDIAKGACCKRQPEKIIAQALEHNLDKIVVPCSGCLVATRQAGQGLVKVLSYPELLLHALAVPGPTA